MFQDLSAPGTSEVGEKARSLTCLGPRHVKTSYPEIWSTLSQHRADKQEKPRALWSCKANWASPDHSTIIANLSPETALY